MKNKELYVKNTAGILEEAGLFLITSCNWTESELAGHFGDQFEKVSSDLDSFKFKLYNITGHFKLLFVLLTALFQLPF